MRVDYEKLALLIRQTRGDRSMREVAPVIGTSPSTISRVELGNSSADELSLQTFIRLCEWANVDPGELFVSDEPRLPSQQIVCNGVLIKIEVRPVVSSTSN